VWLLYCVWEHRLAPFLNVREVHEHRGHALPPLFFFGVEGVAECIHVLFVLLSHSIVQDLYAIVYSLGFRVQGSGFRVQGLGSRIQGLGFRVQGLDFRG